LAVNARSGSQIPEVENDVGREAEDFSERLSHEEAAETTTEVPDDELMTGSRRGLTWRTPARIS
jgi:hypothetical protein